MDKAEEWVVKHGWKKVRGFKFGEEFCNDIKDRDLEAYYIEGATLKDLLDNFDISLVEYWLQEDSDYKRVFEDIDQLIEHIEEETGDVFEEK